MWSLRRRDVDSGVTLRIAEERMAEAKRHAERLKNDPVFRDTERERKSQAFSAMLGPSRKRLPPWPLGATRRVDLDFRKAAFKGNGLVSLMRAAPTVVA